MSTHVQIQGAAMAMHWTEFPELVEKLGDLVAILETLDRHEGDHGFTGASFKNRRPTSAYDVDFVRGEYRFTPRLDRMPGLEQLFDHFDIEGDSALTVVQVRELRSLAAKSLNCGRSAADPLMFTEIAERLGVPQEDSPNPPPAVEPPQSTSSGRRVNTRPDCQEPPHQFVDAAMRELPSALNNAPARRNVASAEQRSVDYARLRQQIENAGHKRDAAEWAIHNHVEADRLQATPGPGISLGVRGDGGWLLRGRSNHTWDRDRCVLVGTPSLRAWWLQSAAHTESLAAKAMRERAELINPASGVFGNTSAAQRALKELEARHASPMSSAQLAMQEQAARYANDPAVRAERELREQHASVEAALNPKKTLEREFLELKRQSDEQNRRILESTRLDFGITPAATQHPSPFTVHYPEGTLGEEGIPSLDNLPVVWTLGELLQQLRSFAHRYTDPNNFVEDPRGGIVYEGDIARTATVHMFLRAFMAIPGFDHIRTAARLRHKSEVTIDSLNLLVGDVVRESTEPMTVTQAEQLEIGAVVRLLSPQVAPKSKGGRRKIGEARNDPKDKLKKNVYDLIKKEKKDEEGPKIVLGRLRENRQFRELVNAAGLTLDTNLIRAALKQGKQ